MKAYCPHDVEKFFAYSAKGCLFHKIQAKRKITHTVGVNDKKDLEILLDIFFDSDTKEKIEFYATKICEKFPHLESWYNHINK